jgi:hypothetical protein
MAILIPGQCSPTDRARLPVTDDVPWCGHFAGELRFATDSDGRDHESAVVAVRRHCHRDDGRRVAEVYAEERRFRHHYVVVEEKSLNGSWGGSALQHPSSVEG